MTTIRGVGHPGWLEVAGPGLVAVVLTAEPHREPLAAAAADGLVALLDALSADGLAALPDFVAVSRTDDGVRVVVRGAAAAQLGDGTRITAGGREPWGDVDVSAEAAGLEVLAVAPDQRSEPAVGWRRPARLDRPAQLDRPAGASPDADEPSGDRARSGESGSGIRSEQPAPAEPAGAAAPLDVTDVDPGDVDRSGDGMDAEPPPPGPVTAPDLTLPPPDDAAGLTPAERMTPPPAPASGVIAS
ncbi:MAG: hypothetical protein ACRCYR_02525, partial [Phycicoccus sp.]